MKNILFAIILVSFASSCDKSEPCESCKLTLVNAEPQYSYIMEFTNWPGAPTNLTIVPGETKTLTIPTGRRINIKGNLQSPFAHNNYIGVAECDGDCSPLYQVMAQ